MQQRFYWRDTETGHITATIVDRCPPGHVRSNGGVLQDGKVLRTSFHMMDAAPMMNSHATFDAAGPTRISDAGSISEALAAAPASTRDLGFKVHQALLRARGALASSQPATIYVEQLRAHAGSYGAHGFSAGDAGKAACERAAQAIMAAADAFEVLSHG